MLQVPVGVLEVLFLLLGSTDLVLNLRVFMVEPLDVAIKLGELAFRRFQNCLDLTLQNA